MPIKRLSKKHTYHKTPPIVHENDSKPLLQASWPHRVIEVETTSLSRYNKEIVWFEHSGHSPWINESSVFVHELLKATKGKYGLIR